MEIARETYWDVDHGLTILLPFAAIAVLVVARL